MTKEMEWYKIRKRVYVLWTRLLDLKKNLDIRECELEKVKSLPSEVDRKLVKSSKVLLVPESVTAFGGIDLMREKGFYLNLFHIVIILLLFILFMFSSIQIAFCMPGDVVNLDIIDVYRPSVNRLPVESNIGYLFCHFEELGNIIRTSHLGRLPGPDEAYELIAQLYPEQLKSLIDPLVEGYARIGADPIIQQRLAYCCTGLLRENMECLTTFAEITRSMSAVFFLTNPGCPLDLSLPLEETFSYLRNTLDFAPDAEHYYAAQILVKTSRLYTQYDRLLALLLSFPL